jgi:hypothetical protein
LVIRKRFLLLHPQSRRVVEEKIREQRS